MSRAWQYGPTPRAERELQRASAQTRGRIFDALDRLVTAPAARDVRKLQGRQEQWRLRGGAWRMIFRRDTETCTIVVLRVLPRGCPYRH